jgi:iron transport multicopper oxidase
MLGLISAMEIGANEMDGAVGITQTEIAPGSEFTYNFQIDHDQEGSFW